MNSRRYREVRIAVLQALATGNYRHETRSGRASEKNLLQVGGVSEDFVARAIEAFPAGRARRSARHL